MSGLLTACCCGATGDLRPCCFGDPPHCEMKTGEDCAALGGVSFPDLTSCTDADVLSFCHDNAPLPTQCRCGAGTTINGVLVQAVFTVCPTWQCTIPPSPCGGQRNVSFGGCGAALCSYIGAFVEQPLGTYCLYCSNFGGTCMTEYSCAAAGGPGIGSACASCRRTLPPPPIQFFQCGYEVQRFSSLLRVAGRASLTETAPIQCTAGGCGNYTSQRATFLSGVDLTGADYTNFCAGQTIVKVTAASQCTPPPGVGHPNCGDQNPGNSTAAVNGAVTWNITRVF